MPQTLEDFTTGSYLKIQPQGPTPNVSFQPMPVGGKLGKWRRTTIGFNTHGGIPPYNQPCQLDIIAKPVGGILIVDTGFGADCGLILLYGSVAPPGVAASPLNLDLSGSSAFQLQFEGTSTAITVAITVWMGTPAGHWGLALQVGANGNPFISDFPFSQFSGTTSSPPPFSDIINIEIQVIGQYSDFGITSFLALP